MSDKSTTMAVRVPHELRDRLQELARRDKRTLSQFCRIILEEYADAHMGQDMGQAGEDRKNR